MKTLKLIIGIILIMSFSAIADTGEAKTTSCTSNFSEVSDAGGVLPSTFECPTCGNSKKTDKSNSGSAEVSSLPVEVDKSVDSE